MSLTATPSPLVKQKGMNGTLLSFLLGACMALAIFLPFLIVDGGFFTYAGDYNSQQLPFYMHVQQFIKTGGGTWDWATDLGGSIVNSYSFYNIGSPFMWLSMLFPNRWMPFMMVPLFILKFGCIAAAAHLFLKRYAKSRNIAVIVSLIYAFCGFNVYNIFFNHMLEPVVIFPLMLWAMDNFVYDKKRGFFALFVGLSLLNSYFFFLGNVTFLLVYFFVKFGTGEYNLTLKDFGLLIFEAVLGVGIGMALALPSYYNLIGNPRTADFADGMNMLLYWNQEQYFNILTSLFLPPDPPYLPNLFTQGAIKWTSMSAFLPIVSVAGVAAYLRARRGTATKLLLLVCLVMALVPFLNSSFYAFNASYYARWFYMPILIMCLATMHSLQDLTIDLKFGAKVALVCTGIYAIFGLVPTTKDEAFVLGVAEYASRFWLTYLTAMLGVVIFYLLVRYGRHRVRFAPLLLSAVMGFTVFYSVIHMSLTKFPQWATDAHIKEEMYDFGEMVNLPDDGFYRIDTFGSYDNLGLWLNKGCLQTFNSTVTPSIMEFYPMVGVKRDVSSKPEGQHYALRGLLSVKYTLIPSRKMEVPVDALNATREQLGIPEEQYAVNYTEIPQDVPFDSSSMLMDWSSEIGWGNVAASGWRFYDEQGPYVIFENQNFVPLGFTYDTYIHMDDLEKAPEEDRAPLLMRAVGLTEEQVSRFGYLFSRREGSAQPQPDGEGSFSYEPVSYQAYTGDVQRAQQNASRDVQASAAGFTSRINLPQENLVFFAVPYDPGFTAMVNGIAAEVLEVSGGMMAVLAPAGENEIVFRYQTPGFALGGSISLLSLALLVLYLVLVLRYRKSDAYQARQRALAAQAEQAAQRAAEKRLAQAQGPAKEAKLSPAGPVLPSGSSFLPPPAPPQEEETQESCAQTGAGQAYMAGLLRGGASSAAARPGSGQTPAVPPQNSGDAVVPRIVGPHPAGEAPKTYHRASGPPAEDDLPQNTPQGPVQ